MGLGATFKEHSRSFNEKKWNRLYPTTKVHVNVKVDIKQTGIVK
ncbi:hypothetical protein J7E67_19495 [Bacillus sp. ISL-46]|nr:hypothetical protein [Bacillus sp. ISL-46]